VKTYYVGTHHPEWLWTPGPSFPMCVSRRSLAPMPPADARTATGSLFHGCPLPGCTGPTHDPREPCEDCKAAFGDYLRPPDAAAPRPTADQYAAQLADRDRETREATARQHAAPEPAVEWRRNQACWVCDQRRTCRHDLDYPDRWICRNCHEEPL
jgi:hypothetical protein